MSDHEARLERLLNEWEAQIKKAEDMIAKEPLYSEYHRGKRNTLLACISQLENIIGKEDCV